MEYAAIVLMFLSMALALICMLMREELAILHTKLLDTKRDLAEYEKSFDELYQEYADLMQSPNLSARDPKTGRFVKRNVY
jgi:uncharacterized coiled-coil DUF342 family protein